MMNCRLLNDPPASGAWNMAVDEVLFDAVREGTSAPVLRWYQWSEPTLSLGYFQRCRDRPQPFASLPAVRRITGGGAILHDRELTYCLVLPADFDPVRTRHAIVELVHRLVAEVAAPRRARLAAEPTPRANEPFLCFQRRSACDLVIEERKIAGSAQRIWHGVLLQHGSILLSSSSFAPQIAGLEECGFAVDIEPLYQRVTSRLAEHWGVRFEPCTLTARERSRAQEIATTKYAQAAWTERR